MQRLSFSATLSVAKQSNSGVRVLPLWRETAKDVRRESLSTIRWSEHNRSAEHSSRWSRYNWVEDWVLILTKY